MADHYSEQRDREDADYWAKEHARKEETRRFVTSYLTHDNGQLDVSGLIDFVVAVVEKDDLSQYRGA